MAKNKSDSGSDDDTSSENESEISLYELNGSSSEDDYSLIDELYESSINEWTWTFRKNNSHFFTSLNYFDGHILGNSDGNKPIDSFFKFITRDVIKLMIDETNTYAKQRYTQSGKNIREWKEVDENELLAFLGVLFIMGFHNVPRIRDYWSQDRNFFTPTVADTMTRDNFYRLFRNIHLADNSKMPSKDSRYYEKTYKVKNFLNLLKRNFQRNYSLGSCLSIDESIVKFKGRSSIKQYEPKKPTKRGYKIWVLSESKTGYVYNFEIYTGKDTNRNLPLGERVVMTMIDGIDLKNRHLFFDNFFNSFPLLYKLKRTGISATGTIRSDRKYFPIQLKKKEELERGDYRYVTSNGISVIKWMDKNEVFVASNYFDPAVLCEVSRRSKDGSRRTIPCPLAISEYNKFMGGVDLSAQRIKSYAIDRKSKRNWMRIFLYFLNMALVNSFIYYKNLSSSNINLLEYISSISTALIGNYCSRKRAGRLLAITYQKKQCIEKSMSDIENPKDLNFWLTCHKLFRLIVDALTVAQKKEKNEQISFVFSVQSAFV